MSNKYLGVWVDPKDLNREIIVGDLIMVETLDDTVVAEVSKICDGEIYVDDWVAPKSQIIAVNNAITTEAYVIKFSNGKFHVRENNYYIGQAEKIVNADIIDEEEADQELQYVKDYGGEFGKTAELLKITISY